MTQTKQQKRLGVLKNLESRILDDFEGLLRKFSLVTDEQVEQFSKNRPKVVFMRNLDLEASYRDDSKTLFVDVSDYIKGAKASLGADFHLDEPAVRLLEYTELAYVTRKGFYGLTGALLNSFEYNRPLFKDFGKKESGLKFFISTKSTTIALHVAKLFQSDGPYGVKEIVETVDETIIRNIRNDAKENCRNRDNQIVLRVIADGDALEFLHPLNFGENYNPKEPKAYTLEELRAVLSKPMDAIVTEKERALYENDTQFNPTRLI